MALKFILTYKLYKLVFRICGTFSEEEFGADQFLSNVCVRDEVITYCVTVLLMLFLSML